MSEKLRREFIELLEKDVEFRYIVAGYLGLSEILKRLDEIEESIRKLWEEVRSLREGQNKLWENQSKLWENQSKLWEEVRSLREGQNKLWEGQNRLWEEVKILREGQNKLWEEVRDIRLTLNRVAITLDRLTISVEEEALSHIKYRIRERLGVDVELKRVFIDTKEINIYGVSGDICVIGEATVRLGIGLINELKEKIELIKMKKPELLRPKLLKVIYADYATPDAIEYAKKEGIWILKWSGDITPMKMGN